MLPSDYLPPAKNPKTFSLTKEKELKAEEQLLLKKKSQALILEKTISRAEDKGLGFRQYRKALLLKALQEQEEW